MEIKTICDCDPLVDSASSGDAGDTGLTIGVSGFDAVVEEYIRPEVGAAYQAMFYHDKFNRVFVDNYVYSTYEKAISDSFEGKTMMRALIRNYPSVIFWVRKIYVDSRRYISARVTQSGEILKVWKSSYSITREEEMKI